MENKDLIGQKIAKVRRLTAREYRKEGWDRTATAIELEDGTKLYASRDPEGNGPGELFGTDKDGGTFIL